MAVVSVQNTIWVTTGGNQSSTPWTPAVNDLIVVVVGTSGVAAGTTNVTDNQSGTYTEIFATDISQSANNKRMNVWVRTALVSSAVSHTVTATQGSSTGGGLATFTVTGMTKTGATAVLTTGAQSEQAASTTPAPPLSATPQSTNPIITGLINGSSPGGVTQRTGYNMDSAAGFSAPTTGINICHLDSGETSATITWGSTSASTFGAFSIELDASGGAAAEEDPFPVLGGGYYPVQGDG